MAFLPAFESLFVLSDGVGMMVVPFAKETPDGCVQVEIPHGFLSAKGMDFDRRVTEIEGTH